ncbi:cadherin-related family member 3-like [Mustelus asterias]
MEREIYRCELCNALKLHQAKEPLHLHGVPDLLRSFTAADVFKWNKLLAETKISLEKAVEKAQETECAEQGVCELKGVHNEVKQLWRETAAPRNRLSEGPMEPVKSPLAPRFFQARPVPDALNQKVDVELKRLEGLGIIKPVQFSEWASPIVPVLKPDRVSGFIKIQGLPATITIQEDTPAGIAIFNFSVVSTITDELMLTPKIAATNPVNNFFIVSVTRRLDLEVIVSENAGLDYETQSNYALLIYVEDDKGNADFQMLTVLLSDVDEPPRFLDNLANGDSSIRTVYIDFLENLAVGEMIYKVQATDPDKDDNTLFYSANSSMVTMISNGAILAAKSFDYEKDLHRNKTIFEISEEKPPHSVIGKVTAYDSDDDSASSSLIYVMSPANRYITINSEFYRLALCINGQSKSVKSCESRGVGMILNSRLSQFYESQISGEVILLVEMVTGELIVSAIIDRDNGPFRVIPTQEFDVVAKDSPSGEHTASLTVIVIIKDINDNQPFCFPHTHSIQIPEKTEEGTTLVTISCRDNDVDLANSQFTTSLQPGLRTNGRFALNGKNNDTIVVIGKLNFEAVTNLEDNNIYVLSVVVTDIAPPYYQDTVTVYVRVTPGNEFHPSFTQMSYTFNISEFSETSEIDFGTEKLANGLPAVSLSIGTKVGRVLAEDKEFPELKFSYSLIGGGSTLGYSQLFWINPDSGEIYLVAQPDYEATAQHYLMVQAVDKDSSDPKTATTTVTVHIFPTNDEPPDCQPKDYSLTILDDTAVGTNIQGFQLFCTDADSSPQSFRYSIASGNINNHFRLSPNAGSNITKLILALPFDYTHGVDKVTNYNLLVLITDDNQLAGSRQRKVVQTGRVKINIRIIIPTPISLLFSLPQPNITYIRLSQNTYQADAWYIPFIITLGCLLLLGMLGYLAYLLAEYIRSIPKSKVEKKPTMNEEEPKSKKQQHVILNAF